MKIIYRLTIALLTFAFGAFSISIAERFISNSMSIDSVPTLSEVVISENEQFCEIHLLPKKAQLIQPLCGKYKSKTFIRGGKCGDSPKQEILLEDAQFIFNRDGGENVWAWWEEYSKAEKAQFPHGYSWQHTECKHNGAVCEEIHACADCRLAEIAWKKNAAKTFRKQITIY